MKNFNNIERQQADRYTACFLVQKMETKIDTEKLGISVDEARKILGIGRNLMLELVRLDGFPAVRFKRKIIINKELMIKWFAENSGKYDGYKY